jgi:gliding motility-associated-like protein
LNVGLPTYSWDFGDGTVSSQSNPSHTYLSSGNFNVKLSVTSNLGCTGKSTDLPLQIFVKPVASYTSEYLLSRGLETDWQFTFTGSGADHYEWYFEDGQTDFQMGPLFKTFSKTGDFKTKLIVYSNQGCYDSLSQMIFLKPELLYHLPTAFSPNNDGLNDMWPGSFTPTFGLKKYRLTVVDRWGNILFKSNDPAIGWNGKDIDGIDVPEGVYAFEINFRYIDDKLYVHRGTLTVLK